jgi:serine phosphatase RsbU (regulator of sigma subunit)
MRWIGAATLFFAVEESNRMARFLHLPSLPQDIFWHGVDIDLRGISNLLFAIVMLIAMTFRLRRIQNRNREVEQEMAAARSVQSILIPDQLPAIPGLSIESAYLPAQEVGGDFFQILPLLNSDDPAQPSAFVVLGDVSGKGLKAAMTVSMIVGTLRAFAETYRSPGELLSALNRRLFGRSDGFATCIVLMIEPSGKVTLANAGHPNPYLNGIEIHTEANLPLGLTPDIHYSEITLRLLLDQRCTLVTDGVVEAASSTTRELFGFDRTRAISNQSATSIAEAARTFGIGAPQSDDITVLTIARSPNLVESIA